MRRKTLSGIIAVGLLLVLGAAPASAKGCPAIGPTWSAWAQQGPGPASTGNVTGLVARSGSTGGAYPVADGPGVIAQVIGTYCS
jgi:hypothetical protein